jgi:excisionase family DNA binding protein
MQDLILSHFPLQQLKTEISEDVFKRIAPLLETVNVPKPETQLLSRKEAAKLLGVSLPTILEWTKTGKITGYRISSRVRYKRSEIESSLSQIKTGR